MAKKASNVRVTAALKKGVHPGPANVSPILLRIHDTRVPWVKSRL